MFSKSLLSPPNPYHILIINFVTIFVFLIRYFHDQYATYQNK